MTYSSQHIMIKNLFTLRASVKGAFLGYKGMPLVQGTQNPLDKRMEQSAYPMTFFTSLETARLWSNSGYAPEQPSIHQIAVKDLMGRAYTVFSEFEWNKDESVVKCAPSPRSHEQALMIAEVVWLLLEEDAKPESTDTTVPVTA